MQAFLRKKNRSHSKLSTTARKQLGFEALVLLKRNIQDATRLKLPLRLDDDRAAPEPEFSPWHPPHRPQKHSLPIANPIQICPSLGRSVLLLFRHDDTSTGGSVGLVVNKPTPLTFLDLSHYLSGIRNAMGALSGNTIHDEGPHTTPLLALHSFAELVVAREDDPLSVVLRDALADPPPTRHELAKCGFGAESTQQEEEAKCGLGAESTQQEEDADEEGFLHVSVVSDVFLEQVAGMIAEGRAEASQFKLVIGSVIWNKDQLSSEWGRNYWYGANSTARVRDVSMMQLTAHYANGTLDGTMGNIVRAGALLKMRRMVGDEMMKMMLLATPNMTFKAMSEWSSDSLIGRGKIYNDNLSDLMQVLS